MTDAETLLTDFFNYFAVANAQPGSRNQFELAREAYWRQFDGVIFETNELHQVADAHPIEVKADTDCFDERLPQQLATAIYYFGEANLVLGLKIAERERRTVQLLPAHVYIPIGDGKFKSISYKGPGHMGALSDRATEGFGKTAKNLRYLYLKFLHNQFLYGREASYTPEEKLTLKVVHEIAERHNKRIETEIQSQIEQTILTIETDAKQVPEAKGEGA